jgi:replicative DNA helicase
MAIQVIDEIEIQNFLSSYDEQYNIFIEQDGIEYISKAKSFAVIENFDYHYERVKKFTLLREYEKNGIDTKTLLDDDSLNLTDKAKKQESFDKMTVADIINYFDMKILEIKDMFGTGDNRSSEKAGENGKEMLEKARQESRYGFNSFTGSLTEITKGFEKTRVTMISSSSGSGKSRLLMGALINVCANKIYDKKLKKWINNINGNQTGLYFCTELTMQELQTMALSFLTKIPQHHLIGGTLTDEENDRIDFGLKVLQESNIFFESLEEYDFKTIETIVESYKLKYGLDLFVFDYIELNSQLENTYSNTRGDLILLRLGGVLKFLAKNLNIAVITASQISVSTFFNDKEHKGENQLANSKSLINKIDCGIILSRITDKELEKIEPILEKKGFDNLVPNYVFNIYKVRNGHHKNSLKVFAHIDLGNLEVTEACVTDMFYNHVNVKQTFVNLIEF